MIMGNDKKGIVFSLTIHVHSIHVNFRCIYFKYLILTFAHGHKGCPWFARNILKNLNKNKHPKEEKTQNKSHYAVKTFVVS